jgi:chromate transporter
MDITSDRGRCDMKTIVHNAARHAFSGRVVRLANLLWAFGRISPMTFGGGYAMLPAIEREIVVKRAWMSREELEEGLAVAATAPGGIGVNAAAFVGYRLEGWLGLIAAVAGITLPAYFVVLALGIGFAAFHDQPKIASALVGIRAAIVALIAYAGWSMMRSSLFDGATKALFALSGALLLLGVHPALVILLGIAAGPAVVKAKRHYGMGAACSRREAERLRSSGTGVRRAPAEDYFIGDGI